MALLGVQWNAAAATAYVPGGDRGFHVQSCRRGAAVAVAIEWKPGRTSDILRVYVDYCRQWRSVAMVIYLAELSLSESKPHSIVKPCRSMMGELLCISVVDIFKNAVISDHFDECKIF